MVASCANAAFSSLTFGVGEAAEYGGGAPEICAVLELDDGSDV